MNRNHFVRISLLAAVALALLAISVPAEAGWRVGLGFNAAIVAPPFAVTVGNAPYWRPWYRHSWRPYCGPVVAPYAAPVVVAPSLARVFVRFPYPHWVMRPVGAARHWERGY